MTTPDAIGDAQVVARADAIEQLALEALAATQRAHDDAVARIAFLASTWDASTWDASAWDASTVPGIPPEPDAPHALGLVDTGTDPDANANATTDADTAEIPRQAA